MVRLCLLYVFFLVSIVGKSQNSNMYFVNYAELPQFCNGDISEYAKFIRNNTKYPESAKISKIEGVVTVCFDIDTLGNTINHRIESSLREDFDKEALRVAKLLKFKPINISKSNSLIGFENWSVPIRFRLPSLKGENKKSTIKDWYDCIKNQSEVSPFVKEDIVHLTKFINKNTVYPENARGNKIEGMVFVEFGIDSLGNTINHRVKYGIRQDFDKEALRVAKLLKFKPVKSCDSICINNYLVPIRFKLPKKMRKRM